MHEYLRKALGLCAWLVILTVVFLPLERLFAVKRRKMSFAEVRADLIYYFVNGVFIQDVAPALIMAAPLALIAQAAAMVTPAAYTEWVGGLPLGVRIVAGLVVSDMGSYWYHRISHKVPLLWRFHEMHHAPEHIYWLMNVRAHPVDMVLTRLCGMAPLYALGLVQSQSPGGGVGFVLVINLIGTVWSYFLHANVKWRLGPLEWLVSTPAFHHWHHTNDEHRDHNFAALLPWIDRLFGSHYLPKAWPARYGVDARTPDAIVDQLLVPFGLGRPPTAASPTPPPAD
jgi:sterol desaturase/sphingolipid hydroxylase (fatty acid hydroxylase superfamily)